MVKIKSPFLWKMTEKPWSWVGHRSSSPLCRRDRCPSWIMHIGFLSLFFLQFWDFFTPVGVEDLSSLFYLLMDQMFNSESTCSRLKDLKNIERKVVLGVGWWEKQAQLTSCQSLPWPPRRTSFPEAMWHCSVYGLWRISLMEDVHALKEKFTIYKDFHEDSKDQ